jgi:hypothetical protein
MLNMLILGAEEKEFNRRVLQETYLLMCYDLDRCFNSDDVEVLRNLKFS